MATFHLVSDTHVDCHPTLPVVNKIKNCNYALLAGDIGNPYLESYYAYIAKFAQMYRNVFLILGNHEYDNAPLQNKLVNIRERTPSRDHCERTIRDGIKKWKMDNVTILQKEAVVLTIPETGAQLRILGCTLWSQVTPEDAKRVNLFGQFTSAAEWNALHLDHKNWLLSEIQKSNVPAIVLVHFGPLHAMKGVYKNESTAFTSNIPELFQQPVIAVCSGHVHSNVITRYNGVLSVSNTLGYPHEKQEHVKYDSKLMLTFN